MNQVNCIYQADCTNILRELPSESIDLIIADPPYYRMKGEFDFVFQTVSQYLSWCLEWVQQCYRILKPTGAFYCWGSSLMIDKLSVEVLDRFGWKKRNLIVWNYRTGRPAKAAYRMETEFLWFYSNPMHQLNHDAIRIPYAAGWEKDRRKNPKGKTCGNVWEFPRISCSEYHYVPGKTCGNVWEFPRICPNYKEATEHPTQKPEKLAERMIRASSNAGDLVVIPFAGSGSEIVQCIKNGRDFIASEINPFYVQEIILPRLKKECGMARFQVKNGISGKEGEA